MKIKLLLPLACAVLLQSACTSVYSPAMFHQDIAYVPKPSSFDKESTSRYVSAGANINPGYGLDDVFVSGQLNLSQGHRFDNFNIGYGGFASFGSYQNRSIDKDLSYYTRDRFFGAVGGRFSANAFVTQDRADIRFIGIEAAYSHEFGDYADFRRVIAKQPDLFVDTRTNLFSVGLTSEVIFHNQGNTDLQHGIRGYLGTTFGNNHVFNTKYENDDATERMFRNLYPKIGYYMKVKDFFGTMEAGKGFMVRFGYRF